MEKDFETLYPNRTLKLYVAWPKLSNFVINKVTPKLKNRFDNVFTPGQIFYLVFFYNFFTSGFTYIFYINIYILIDGIKIVTLLLMPHLFPVNTIRNKKAQNWRPSRRESEEGFLLYVNVRIEIKIMYI